MSVSNDQPGQIKRSHFSSLQDEDILIAWLTDLHYEEYFNLFVSAGYDMPTISRYARWHLLIK